MSRDIHGIELQPGCPLTITVANLLISFTTAVLLIGFNCLLFLSAPLSGISGLPFSPLMKHGSTSETPCACELLLEEGYLLQLSCVKGCDMCSEDKRPWSTILVAGIQQQQEAHRTNPSSRKRCTSLRCLGWQGGGSTAWWCGALELR